MSSHPAIAKLVDHLVVEDDRFENEEIEYVDLPMGLTFAEGGVSIVVHTVDEGDDHELIVTNNDKFGFPAFVLFVDGKAVGHTECCNEIHDVEHELSKRYNYVTRDDEGARVFAGIVERATPEGYRSFKQTYVVRARS